MKYEQLTSLDINQVPWLNLKPKSLTKEQLENFKLFIESNKSVINSLLKAVEERQKTLIETNKSIPKFDIIQLSPKKENYDMLPYYVMSNTSITDVIITTIGGKNPGYHIFKYGLDSERDAMLYNIQSELIVLELQLQTYWNSIQ